MNTKNKILKVLEKVPSGTKLYSTAFGNLELESIIEGFAYKRIKLIEDNRDSVVYFPDGRYRKGGEVTLYPSREMRDWYKFAWKKGDVLTNKKGALCIFKKFKGYPYTTFVATFVHIAGVSTSDSTVEFTQEWNKASGENAGKYIKFINTNLEKESKRLNLETLEVEKLQQKFKDGDILTCPSTSIHNKSTFIFKKDKEWEAYGYSYYVAAVNSGELYINNGNTWWCGKGSVVRYATEEEKTKLFNALTKEGKRWNAEKKVIEDIKPKPKKENATYKKVSDKPEHEFQPFEKVLVRDSYGSTWEPDFFSRKACEDAELKYMCLTTFWKYCIPYKGNEHLLGTTNNPE